MTSPQIDSGAIPTVTPNMVKWLDSNWPLVGAVVAVFLACLLPLIITAWPLPLTLTYLLLLVYLLHQLEEHLGDRFRRFVNTHVAGGVEALTPRATMWINVGAVWALYVLILLLQGFVDVGFGLIVVYTTLLDGLVHVVVAVAMRRYNPGLVTALCLFLPFGAWTFVAVTKSSGLGVGGHVIGIVVAVLVHAVIVVTVRLRTRDAS